jgi:hypothetical protein
MQGYLPNCRSTSSLVPQFVSHSCACKRTSASSLGSLSSLQCSISSVGVEAQEYHATNENTRDVAGGRLVVQCIAPVIWGEDEKPSAIEKPLGGPSQVLMAACMRFGGSDRWYALVPCIVDCSEVRDQARAPGLVQCRPSAGDARSA